MGRPEICAAVDTQLKIISTANGYSTNVLNVFEWIEYALVGEDDAPALIWRDTTDEPETDRYGGWDHSLTVEVEGVIHRDTGAAGARALAADVLKAVKVDDTWGGLAEMTEVTEVSLTEQEGADTVTGVLVALSIKYKTERHEI